MLSRKTQAESSMLQRAEYLADKLDAHLGPYT